MKRRTTRDYGVGTVERYGRGNLSLNNTREMKSGMFMVGLAIAAVMLLMTACTAGSEALPTTVSGLSDHLSPTPSRTSLALSYVSTEANSGLTRLRCEECEEVEVTGVVDAETLQTSEGPVRLYGVFVDPQEQNCAEEGIARLVELAGSSVRVEKDQQEADSSGTPIRYIYTANGDSIDELFISEGIARSSAFEGSHSPWLLLTSEKARRERGGCIWENYDRLFPSRTPAPAGGLN